MDKKQRSKGKNDEERRVVEYKLWKLGLKKKIEKLNY